jgi:hypothetical protein
MTSSVTSDCRFCSLVSQANGEDPIGSAPVADHWLIVELPQPWSAEIFQDDPVIRPVFALIKQLILKHGVKLRPIAIAPDRQYSRLGYRRVIYYYRTDPVLQRFQMQEYLVPEDQYDQLAIALLHSIIHPDPNLAQFEPYRVETQTRDILVCTHGNVDAACSRFGFPIYEKLRKAYANVSLRVWRCTHFGGHQYAPTLVDLPSGRYWGHVEVEMLDRLVQQQGDLAQLYRYYRGWAGLGKFAQIAEREIWMREGWQWLTYSAQGSVLHLGESIFKRWMRRLLNLLPSRRIKLLLERSQQDARWAIVQIDYVDPAGETVGSYQARVEISGQIQTAIHSAPTMPLVPVNQYRVVNLRRRRRDS